MASSLRKSIHRRNHKERSQLAHRARLGILEKHADYVKRARDYHSKQDRINRLKQKAADRNKDEFYFSMSKEKTKGGVHVKDRGTTALPTDIVKVLKSQDENYVRTMRASNRKKIDKLKTQLMALVDLIKPLDKEDAEDLDQEELDILVDAGILLKSKKGKGKARPNGHLMFADTAEEAQRFARGTTVQPVPADFQRHGMKPLAKDIDLGWKAPLVKRKSPRRKSLRSTQGKEDLEMDSQEDAAAEQHRRRLLKELSARLVRDTQLRYAEREFEMQRTMMGKGGRKKLAAPAKLGGLEDSKEDEDEIDARKGKHTYLKSTISMDTYKPRIYKWRQERKR